MKEHRRLIFARACGLIACAALCAAPAVAAQSPHDTLARFVGRSAQPVHDPDELAALAAQRAVGYAGITLRPDGVLEASFTQRSELFGADGRAVDWSRSDSPAGRLARQLGAQRLRRVAFDAIQLADWKRSARALLGFRPVHWIDIDEGTNRLAIGIEDRAPVAQETALHGHLRSIGVPDSAISIVREATAEPYQQIGESLQFQIPPLAAGAKLLLYLGDAEQAGGKCTLAAAVLRDGVAGFLTASHCSATMFAADPPQANQRVVGPTNTRIEVGHEAVDPAALPEACAWRGTGAPPTLPPWPTKAAQCRFADASFVATRPGAVAVGRLLRAARVPLGSPSSPVADAVDRFVGTESFPVLGSAVAKVGMKTGAAHGRVSRTCVDTLVTQQGQATGKVLLCQWKALLYARHGDSGAPVFVPAQPRWASGLALSARQHLLAGVLSFGPAVEPETEAAAQAMEIGFSPWGSIAFELGGQWQVTTP